MVFSVYKNENKFYCNNAFPTIDRLKYPNEQ